MGRHWLRRPYPPPATLLPPAEFWAHASAELALLIDDEELWIFVQVGADEHDAFAEASSDLLIQLKTVHQLPICILALTDARTDAVRRAYLNPAALCRRPNPRAAATRFSRDGRRLQRRIGCFCARFASKRHAPQTPR